MITSPTSRPLLVISHNISSIIEYIHTALEVVTRFSIWWVRVSVKEHLVAVCISPCSYVRTAGDKKGGPLYRVKPWMMVEQHGTAHLVVLVEFAQGSARHGQEERTSSSPLTGPDPGSAPWTESLPRPRAAHPPAPAAAAAAAAPARATSPPLSWPSSRLGLS